MDKPKAAGAAPASPPTGQTAEGAGTISAEDVKARIKAITEDEAAQGHDVLAKHFAFDTDLPAEEAIAALKAAATDAPQASDDETPDPKAYQAGRSAASDLAQPVPGGKPKTQSAIDTRGIYARRSGKET